MLKAACERQVACGVVVVNQATTVAECLKGCDAEAAAIDASPLAARDDELQSCEAAITSASCADLANRRLSIVPECHERFAGTLAKDAPCTANAIQDPCGDGLACTGSAAAGLCGTCQPAAVAVACIEGSCPEGQFCNAGLQCTPQAVAGASCELLLFGNVWDSSCAAGTWCDPTQHCAPPLPPGAVCSTLAPYECASGYACVLGDGGGTTCQPARAVGETCHIYSECAIGLSCVDGKCAERQPAGAACSSWYGACEPGLACVDGACGPPSPPAPPPLQPILARGARCGLGAVAGGVCPLGTACLCDDHVTCASMSCHAGPKLGEPCPPFVGENPFDPDACSEGVCDLATARPTCVEPSRPPGAACDFEELTGTFECLAFLCEHHRCLDLVDPTCH